MNELSTRFKQAYDYLLSNGFITGNKDFAAKIGVSTSMITEIFKGRSNVGTTALQNIVYVFNIDANWLFTGLGTMVINDEAVQPVDLTESSVYYNMYKEERAKSDAQAEQIGALKQTIRQLEEKILGLQQDSRPDFISDTGKASDGSTQIRKSDVAGSESARFAEQP